MSGPRHKWQHHAGKGWPPSDDFVQKCSKCGVFTSTRQVETSRVGIRTATFNFKRVPIYSKDEQTWTFDKPACVDGKAVGK